MSATVCISRSCARKLLVRLLADASDREREQDGRRYESDAALDQAIIELERAYGGWEFCSRYYPRPEEYRLYPALQHWNFPVPRCRALVTVGAR